MNRAVMERLCQNDLLKGLLATANHYAFLDLLLGEDSSQIGHLFFPNSYTTLLDRTTSF